MRFGTRQTCCIELVSTIKPSLNHLKLSVDPHDNTIDNTLHGNFSFIKSPSFGGVCINGRPIHICKVSILETRRRVSISAQGFQELNAIRI